MGTWWFGGTFCSGEGTIWEESVLSFYLALGIRYLPFTALHCTAYANLLLILLPPTPTPSGASAGIRYKPQLAAFWLGCWRSSSGSYSCMANPLACWTISLALWGIVYTLTTENICPKLQPHTPHSVAYCMVVSAVWLVVSSLKWVDIII